MKIDTSADILWGREITLTPLPTKNSIKFARTIKTI
jgi:hypothetical protein